MDKRTDLKIPYGIADFKRIRNEGWYYVDKTGYLAKLEGRGLVRLEAIPLLPE